MKKSISQFQFSWSYVIIFASCICILIYKYNSEHPKAEWDTSPDNIVVSSSNMFEEIDYGYIPDFQVWGDGHIVWVEHDQDFTRKVYEGYLSQNQLKEIIEQFVDAGYYKWFGNKNSHPVNVSIGLLNSYKQNSFDANGKISKLAEYLESGAGVDAKEFIPTVGYLYVFPIKKTAYKNTNVIPIQWAGNKYESNFENFERIFPNGKEITGEELDFLWHIVNHSPFIEANGDVYWIAVEIPKVSFSITVR